MKDDSDLQNLSPDSLSSLILNHWKLHEPKKLQQFQQENRLQEELEAATENYADLLYELMIVQKLPYPAAMEVVTHIILHQEPEESVASPSQNQNKSLPATFE